MLFFKKKSSVQKGQSGEDKAVKFLKEKGFKILERNFKFNRFEIDIIAEKQGQLSFVEVKTQKASSSYSSDLKVNKDKRVKIIRTAKYYLNAIYKKEINYKFDILCVIEDVDSYEIKHIQNAFNELSERNVVF